VRMRFLKDLLSVIPKVNRPRDILGAMAQVAARRELMDVNLLLEHCRELFDLNGEGWLRNHNLVRPSWRGRKKRSLGAEVQ
jgi:hypothetical protein